MLQLLPETLERSVTEIVGGAAGFGRAPHDGRPWVLVNMIASVDGAIAVDGRSGGLGGPADQAMLGALRATADVVLVGAGTVRAEGYRPPRTPGVEAAAGRTARSQTPRPRLAVVTARGDLDAGLPMFADHSSGDTADDPLPLVFTTPAGANALGGSLGDRAEVVVAGDGADVAPVAVLAGLADRGAGVVLVEGGPTLNGRMVADGLVDELCVTVAPMLVGGGDGGLLAGSVPEAPTALQLVGLATEDGLLFCHYLVG